MRNLDLDLRRQRIERARDLGDGMREHDLDGTALVSPKEKTRQMGRVFGETSARFG